MEHERYSNVKDNELLAEHTTKKHRNDISIVTIFMNTENSKTNKPHKFILKLSQRLDPRSSNKHVALQSMSVYYTWKNIRQQYKNNKPKIIAPTWNDEFELLDGSYSVSDIHDFIEYIVKKLPTTETLPTISPIHIYINKINDRWILKIKMDIS